MEKFAMMATFINILTAHQFGSYLREEIPKVEMVPHIRKIITAVDLFVFINIK